MCSAYYRSGPYLKKYFFWGYEKRAHLSLSKLTLFSDYISICWMLHQCCNIVGYIEGEQEAR